MSRTGPGYWSEDVRVCCDEEGEEKKRKEKEEVGMEAFI